MSNNLAQAKSLLKEVRGKAISCEERIKAAIQLAAFIQNEANLIQTRQEKAYAKQMSRMMQDPEGKSFVVEMMDQAFRSSSSSRTADQIRYLLSRHGIPRFLEGFERWGMKAFKFFGALAVPFMKYLIRKKTAQVIFPEENLRNGIVKLQKEGVQVNLNHLGEAILGEEEAEKRLETYLNDLEKPEVDYISVKISTLYSQINLLSHEKSLEALSTPYKKLLLKAYPKFVNLDMEEYKDLHMTVALFKKVLIEPEFLHIPAGIVLQSYLPDSYPILLDLLEFAKKRPAPIKIRIVKGANLAMEKVESSLRGWPQAPYEHKSETDANFIRMLDAAIDSPNVKVGIGSHNLFDIAYGLILGKSGTIEMLMGMSEPARRVISKLVPDVLLYCPAANKEEFQNAIAYLVRRLDENTGEENFLRAQFHLTAGSVAWQHQADLFARSVIHSQTVSSERRRTQNIFRSGESFQNEPDTDWALPENVVWAEGILKEWKEKEISLPTSGDIEEVLQRAKGGASIDFEAIAEKLRKAKVNLIGVMVKEVNKSIPEADVEVSEAIDFAVYYAHNLKMWQNADSFVLKPKGTILVASPWNFPCSIAAGGILAALAGGNAVIFKPAPEAALVGYELVKLFWEAGVPKESLQFVPCQDEEGSILVKDPRVAAVVLTGATATAKMMLKMRPGLDLIAETGGKNSIIVSKMADRDLAIKDIIQSAFGFSGQKCSACSLVILDAEVYDDPHFKSQLKSAAMSLSVGSQWDPASKITPLIRSPEGPLKKALEDEGEWLLKPALLAPNLMTPGIKWGVKPGSFMHQTELFGPVIGVMRAENLQEAIQIANSTPYGLTSGLHSLDEREHAVWLQKIRSGNCYINRGITGAIVERQPFGGTKASSFGKGAKAGGPNYLLQMMTVEEKSLPAEKAAPSKEVQTLIEEAKPKLTQEEIRLLDDSASCYSYFWKHFFSKPHDPMKLYGQDNLQIYLPHEHVELRVCKGDKLVDILRVSAAAITCNTPLFISDNESDLEFAARLSKMSFPRVRLLQKPSQELMEALSSMGLWIPPEPVHSNGRLELLHYLREVSVSYDYHRYGNVTRRE